MSEQGKPSNEEIEDLKKKQPESLEQDDLENVVGGVIPSLQHGITYTGEEVDG